jgi:4-alpha-glucanotransferase
MEQLLNRRGSGILLHITSLPSPYGIGDLGPDAFAFADFLHETHQHYWQILPLTLTSPAYGNSPYSSFSSFAGNILLISPEKIVRDGFLDRADLPETPSFSQDHVDYDAVRSYKKDLLDRTFAINRDALSTHQDFGRFCEDNASWLDDYCLFMAVRRRFNEVEWSRWPDTLRDRHPDALKKISEEFSEDILKEKFLQYLFFVQWFALKKYCDSRDIKILGDIPIYVNYDSTDVWANPDIFKLDDRRRPESVAGVPPDYFSSTGQLWGHPVYRWEVLRDRDYDWWIRRIAHNLKLYDMFRLDHFRGFIAFWEVNASETTAINGRWVEAPADDFLSRLTHAFPNIPIIAEDLGVITDDVRQIMKKFGFPGMKVLIFAFGEDLPTNPYAPHNHEKHCVVYTGTHDNNTIKGWFRQEVSPDMKKLISRYVGRDVSEKNIHHEMIRLAMMSVADMVIIPMQDMLGLDENHRMNLPASAQGNWEWRMQPEMLTTDFRKRLADMTEIYGRASLPSWVRESRNSASS